VKTSIPGFYATFKSSFRSAAEGSDTIAWLAATPRFAHNTEERKTLAGALFRDREVELEHFKFAGTSYTEGEQDQMYNYLSSKIKHH
jgi:hypothetical protein